MFPPRPWGKGGHLDLLWFPVTQMCVRDHLRPSGTNAAVAQPRMWHKRECGQSLFTLYFLQFFTNGFHIRRYGDHGQDLELINFL